MYWCEAQVSHIRPTPWSYSACPDCARKAVREGSADGGCWFCDKCNKQFPAARCRYVLTVQLMDATGSLWAFAFDETAEPLLGKTADAMRALSESADLAEQARFHHAFADACFRSYRFKMQATQEEFHGVARVSSKILACQPMEFASSASSMLQKFQHLLAEAP